LLGAPVSRQWPTAAGLRRFPIAQKQTESNINILS
jgi:hypothetical protein